MDGVTRDWLGHFRPNENALTMVECDMIGEHAIVPPGVTFHHDERTVEIVDQVSGGPHPAMRVWAKRTISHAEVKRRGLLWQATIEKTASLEEKRAYFRRLWLASAPIVTFVLEQRRLGVDDQTLYSFDIAREADV